VAGYSSRWESREALSGQHENAVERCRVKKKQSSSPKTRWWFPVFVIAAAVAGIWWMYDTGVALRSGYSLGVGLLAMVLFAFWYVFLIGRTWRGKGIALFKVLALFAVVGGAFFGLFRYDGSSDGTAMPQLAFRWKKSEKRTLRPLALDAAEATSPGVAHMDSPQFLGPQRTGIISGVRLVTDWAKSPPKEVWRREVGGGWAGFAVAGTRAVTLEQRNDEEVVVCYDLATGTPRWAREKAARFVETTGGDGPRSTPTIVGDRVFAVGGTGVLDCLDLANGDVLWSRDLLADTGTGLPTYGMAGSPLVEGELVIVNGGSGSGSSLIAYGVTEGEEVWQGGKGGAAYASPMIAEFGGERMIISVNGEDVSAHALATGEVLWNFPWKAKWPKSSQPVTVGSDRLFLSASYGMGAHLLEVRHEAGRWSAEELWSSLRMKTKFSSVCVRDGYAYGLDEGQLACIGLEEGDRQWRESGFGFGQNLLVGDTLLVQAENGEVVLVAADPSECRELARMSALDGKTWNIPTLAAPYLLVRNDHEAACYLLPCEPAN
jgi:outer membrane protein assembly factor BamB